MTGRIFAITGAFGALGQAVARAAAGQGGRVALIDMAGSAPAGLAAACGDQALVLGGVDLTDPAQTTAAVDETVARFGGLDVLVNIAGGFRWEGVEGGDPGTWDRLYALNVKTAANASRAAIGALKASRAGRIVNVGANAALKAAVGMGAYGASKSGVHALTQALADELKATGVTVNAVLPSILDTAANRADMPQARFEDWVAPGDLAAVILFLASEEARAVTGALVPVTGRV